MQSCENILNQVAQTVKNLPAMQETQVQTLSWEDPLENGMATHSSILACRIPWTVNPMGLQRVGHVIQQTLTQYCKPTIPQLK